MRRWRDRLCRLTRCSSRHRPTSCRTGWIAETVLEVEWGADVGRFRPDAPGTAPFAPRSRRASCACLPARSARGTARSHLAAALARLHAAGDGRFGGVFIGDGPERARPSARPAVCRACSSPARCRTTRCRPALAARRHRRGAVRSGPARPASTGLLLVAAEDLRIHGVGTAGGRAGAAPTGRLVEHGREGVLYDPEDPRGLDRAIRGAGRSADCASDWARPPARASSAISAGSAHCRALDARLARRWCAAMSAPLRVLIVTDAFPPVCGGSGWSTLELARGLVARGHHVEVVKVDTAADRRVRDDRTRACRVTEFRRPRQRRCRSSATCRRTSGSGRRSRRTWRTRLRTAAPFDVVHGQHVMTTVPSIDAGAARPACRRSPRSATTGRSATGRISSTTRRSRRSVPRARWRMMTRCVQPRAGGRADGRLAADSVHAREPADQALDAGARRCGDRAEPCDRPRPARARAGTRARRRSTRFPIRST